MGDLTDPYWTVADLVDRVHSHDWSAQTWEILVIVHTIAENGRVRTIGRRCDDADRPLEEWEQIPAHQFADLKIDLSPRDRPHPGDLFWRSSGRRAWAFIQFSERDLMREWLGEVFARPKREAPADIIVPPRRSGHPTHDQEPPMPEEGATEEPKFEANSQGASKPERSNDPVSGQAAQRSENRGETNQRRLQPLTKKDAQTLFNEMIASANPLPNPEQLNEWARANRIAVRRVPVLRRACPDERLHKRGRRSTNPD